MHTFKIYIAWSNLVSPSNSDAHHVGQVQVRMRMKIYALSGFVSSIINLPLLSLSLLRQECHSYFLSFSGGCWFSNHYLNDFGVMDVYVNDPRRWINLNFFGGTKFEQAHNAKDSYRFELVCMALEWVLAKLSIRALIEPEYPIFWWVGINSTWWKMTLTIRLRRASPKHQCNR